MDLDKLSNIFGQDTVKRIYEDAASQPVQEASQILKDFIKAARLFTAPIQLLAACQDRLTKFFDSVREKVPEANQTEAPASISGPIIERLKYLEDKNYLTELYLNLLARAIDKERINEAHPAFYHIIDQLSQDEAMLLYLLSKEPIFHDYTMDLCHNESNQLGFRNRVTKKETINRDQLAFPEHFNMYINHMKALDLVFWKRINETALMEDDKQTGTYVYTQIGLTEFGALFIKACIPEKGFILL